MKAVWKRVGASGVSALLSVLLCGQAFAKDIVVMQTGDYSGAKAALGKAWRQGTQVAFAQINEQGGIRGNKIKLVALDDQYKPELTASLLNDAIPREQPVLLVGVLGTGNTGEVFKQKLLEKYEIPLLGVYSGSDALRTPTHPYTFHIRASYGDEVDKMVENYATTGVKKIAVITEKNPFGNAVTAAFNTASKKYPVTVVSQLQVAGDAKEFKEVIEALRKANPNGVVLGTAGASTALLIKAIREAGLGMQLVTLSVNDIPQIMQAAGKENARGLAQIQVMPDPDACRVALCREFQMANKKYGDSKIPASPATMEGYVTGKIAIAALQRAGGEPNRKSVLNALNNLGNLDLGGFSINFAPNKHNGSRYMDIGVLNQNGRMLY